MCRKMLHVIVKFIDAFRNKSIFSSKTEFPNYYTQEKSIEELEKGMKI